MAKAPNGDGTTRKLPSGRWQARFIGPDGVRRSAPETFDAKVDAQAWLKRQALDVHRLGDQWTPEPEKQKAGRLSDYAERWLGGRDLKPRTRIEYRRVLDAIIIPDLGDVYLNRLTPSTVRRWYESLDPARPTRRAHAYSLLRTILTTAVADELIANNPCKVRGGGSNRKVHETRIATLAELDAIVAAMSPRYRSMVLLAGWCAMRFGELTALRRQDVDVETGVIRIRRGVTRIGQGFVVGTPKSNAGTRSVVMPPHIVDTVKAHLADHVDIDDDALLFPAAAGGFLSATSLHKVWHAARLAAGRPDLHFHDLRHTGATMYAVAGATLGETQAMLGHSTVAAAMVYQHIAAERPQSLAEKMSALAAT